MNRQQRRRVHKLTGEELKKIRLDSIQRGGVQFTLNTVYEVMNEEFGFGGDKRLDRLENRILEKIREMEE